MLNKLNLRKIIASVFIVVCMAFSTLITLNGLNNINVASASNERGLGLQNVNVVFNSENVIESYKITYKDIDGNVLHEQVFTLTMIEDGVSLWTPSQVSGKTHKWLNGSTEVKTLADVGLNNIDLYLVYVDKTFKATFYLGDSIISQDVVVGNKPLSFFPSKDGYVFNGWVNAQGSAYDFNAPINSDVEIYATWEQISEVDTEDDNDNAPNVSATQKDAMKFDFIALACYVVLAVGVVLAVLGIVFLVKKNKSENK